MDKVQDLVRLERDARGVATLALNRPDRHNALSAPLVGALTAALERLAGDDALRVIVLTGEGRSFCAGADIGEMRAAADASQDDNEADARRLATLLHRLDSFPRPTVARVQGNAFGGALGLIAACDVAVGVDTAVLSLSEVRLGIAPAMISPYVLRAIGPRQARRLCLTGERLDAATAARIGLLHEAVPAERLDATVATVVTNLLQGAPGAQARIKRLLADVAGRDEATEQQLAQSTARWIAQMRAAPEGREGLSAFLEKRPARWVRG
jgi:methylglutaconyl-CoA hydratase